MQLGSWPTESPSSIHISPSHHALLPPRGAGSPGALGGLEVGREPEDSWARMARRLCLPKGFMVGQEFGGSISCLPARVRSGRPWYSAGSRAVAGEPGTEGKGSA